MRSRLVQDIGEFALIDRLQRALPDDVRETGPAMALGIGDDAAIWRPPAGERLAITTDALIESIHFRLDWTSWEGLGHKALAVNLSDLAAMGADPALAVVTLGLRGDERLDDLEAMYRGAGALAHRHGVSIAGGDVVRVPDHRLVSITALGSVPTRGALVRSGAKPGDVIGVTGTLGASAAGMRILQHPAGFRESATAPALVRAHVRPEPRVDAGSLLAGHGVRVAMDLSDGLAGDLPKILEASDVAGIVEEAAIPVIAAVRALFPDDFMTLALHGGEDYELLFTAPRDVFSEVQRDAAARGVTITAIGEIHDAGAREPRLQIRRRGGVIEPLRHRAFDHFA